MPHDIRGRMDAMQWLFWQVAGLGPMVGQLIFFKRSSERFPFAVDRYTKETARLYGVLNKRLADREYLAGRTYSIADIAAYTWTALYNLFELNRRISARGALARGHCVASSDRFGLTQSQGK
jgi:GSH-dependent disulfide-bond oxidoreductase